MLPLTEKSAAPFCLRGWIFVICTILTLLLPGVGRVVAEQKVAILFSDDADLEALLTAQLKEAVELKILSRSDLPNLANELKVGVDRRPIQITEADFLVSSEKEGSERLLRLTDCQTGAVIYSALIPDGLDIPKTAEWMALRLPGYLRSVAAPDARRVSFLGFRFDTDSAVHRSFERRLNLAFSALLQESGQAVLLERWRMRDLVFEKSLRVEPSGAFWQGAELIDGSLSQKGEGISAHLRLRFSGHEEETKYQVELDSSDPLMLARKLVDTFLKRPQSERNSSLDEGHAYEKEARWLLDHGLPFEAVQAVESAIALGLMNRDVEMLRIKAYSMSAYPDDFKTFFQDGGNSDFRFSMPTDRMEFSVKMASEAVTLSKEWLGRYSLINGVERMAGFENQSLLAGVYGTSLCVLRAAHSEGYYERDASAVEGLRQEVIEYMTIVEPLLTSAYQRYFHNKVSYVAYWNRTPEDAVAYYRKILAPDFHTRLHSDPRDAVRKALGPGYKHEPLLVPFDGNRKYLSIGIPRLIGWDQSQTERLQKVWSDFIDELGASTVLLTQVDAIALRFSSLPPCDEGLNVVGKAVDFVHVHSEVLKGADGNLVLTQLRPALSLANSDQRLEDAQRVFVDSCVQWLQSDRWIPGLIIPQISRFSFFFPGRSFTRQELEDSPTARRELEEQEMKWARRRSPELVAVYRAYATRLLTGIREHRRRLPSETPASYLQILTNQEAVIIREFPELAHQKSNDALVVRRAWLRLASADLDRYQLLQNDTGLWRDGGLWFLSGGKSVFLKVDLLTFKTQVVTSHGGPELRANASYEVLGGRIFVADGKGIWSLDLTSMIWERLDLPDNSYRLYLLNGSLWALFGMRDFSDSKAAQSSGGGLYRIDPTTAKAELVFSSRRRPAEHPLDETEAGAPLLLLPGECGSPNVGFQDAKKSFRRVSDGVEIPWSLTYRIERANYASEGALIMQTTGDTPAGRFHHVVSISADGRQEVLLKNADIPNGPIGEPVWRLPEGLKKHSHASRSKFNAAILGDRFYLLAMEGLASPWGASKTELYVFQRGVDQPTRIPLRFDLPANFSDDKEQRIAFEYPMLQDHGLVATDEGLVLSGFGMDGFWFIPNEDIEAKLGR